jgi:hypothetical protein
VRNISEASGNTIYIIAVDLFSARETECVAASNQSEKYNILDMRILNNRALKSVAGAFQEPGTEFLVIAQPIILAWLSIKKLKV